MSWRVGDTLTHESHTPSVEVLSASLTLTAGGVLAGMPDIVLDADIIGGKAVWEIPAGALGYYSHATGMVHYTDNTQAVITVVDADDPTAPILRPAGQRGAVFIYDGVMWDTAEHGLFCTALTVGSPEVRQNKREALARDGFIDLTEQFGRPVFGNRAISWRFLVTEEDWQTRCEEVREFIADLHGRRVGILVDDYEGWAFTGRLALERVVHQLDGTYVEVTADCDPFRRDGSEYTLDADAESFTLGPAVVIEPDRDISAYLQDASTYELVVDSTAQSLTSWKVLYLRGELPALNHAFPSSATSGTTSTWQDISEARSHWTAGQSRTFSVYSADRALVVPNVPGGLDLYALFEGATIAPGATFTTMNITGSFGTVSLLPKETPVLLDTIGSGDPAWREYTFTLNGSVSRDTNVFMFKIWFAAIPHGVVPTKEELYAASHAQGPIVISSGNSGETPFVVSEKYSISHANSKPLVAAYGKNGSGQPVQITAEFDVVGVAVQDLSELGHRFYALTADIPATSTPATPSFIDIDGRRYYADDTAYTVKSNAGYRSRVSVHGDGPSITAEGLAI